MRDITDARIVAYHGTALAVVWGAFQAVEDRIGSGQIKCEFAYYFGLPNCGQRLGRLLGSCRRADP